MIIHGTAAVVTGGASGLGEATARALAVTDAPATLSCARTVSPTSRASDRGDVETLTSSAWSVSRTARLPAASAQQTSTRPAAASTP